MKKRLLISAKILFMSATLCILLGNTTFADIDLKFNYNNQKFSKNAQYMSINDYVKPTDVIFNRYNVNLWKACSVHQALEDAGWTDDDWDEWEIKDDLDEEDLENALDGYNVYFTGDAAKYLDCWRYEPNKSEYAGNRVGIIKASKRHYSIGTKNGYLSGKSAGPKTLGGTVTIVAGNAVRNLQRTENL